MTFKPIDPDTHGALDYGFIATIFAAPSVFGLKGNARKFCYGFGALASVLVPLTDQKYSVRRVIPFRIHGDIETVIVPSILLGPLALGALRRRNERVFFGSYFLTAAVNWMLTDWDAQERKSLSPVASGAGERRPRVRARPRSSERVTARSER